MPDIYRKTSFSQVGDDVLKFVMSDATPDRMGDVIEPSGWNLSEFKKNPIALFNHNSDFPIGRWVDVKIESNALTGHLDMAPLGTSPRIDEARRLVLAGIMRTVSVGFIAEETAPLSNGGTRYRRQRLIECSLTPTPANPNALRMEARALGVSETVIKQLIDHPPKNASFSQRADHARSMLSGVRARAKGRANAEAIIKRVNEKVRAEMAERERARNARQRALDMEILNARPEDVLAVVIRQDEDAQRRLDKHNLLVTERRASRRADQFAAYVRQGADPQQVMRAYLDRLLNPDD
ncbi:HK97 family phage prohead protease [Bradyrhizobium sp. 157]|uniref:HK97 family phage prohead protease n=1 Tax=Bradyrhizobium sp. 157 TaxID=2782631 RepID=UPI001FFC26DF|nr:HK97 family phage prohead protease [Bradyrhizobium sp. 157]MCK1639103.1 HK97 family phage prohead protease [Bradyrhizobium sp. 157]